jgi:ribosomal protein L7/L12
MQIANIRIAKNGFVLEDNLGEMHIARTLTELATLVGEALPYAPVNTYTCYSHGYGAGHLATAVKLYRKGDKIGAIKLLRDSFTPRLGLKEAKELIEELVSL